MAQFTKISDNSYRIEGVLTLEDIERINNIEEQTYLIMNNTKGQTSEILGQIDNLNVLFRVLGGLNPDEKKKYEESTYVARTEVSPQGLSKIVQYYENIEAQIDPNWTDTQKAMFLYGYMAEDIEYTEKEDPAMKSAKIEITDDTEYKDIEMYNRRTTSRSLNGLLYHSLVCAGYAQCFKEGMDRLGIPCYYQNRKDVHCWNVVNLDGKLVGVDLTWDSYRKNKCTFSNFGPANFGDIDEHKPATTLEWGDDADIFEMSDEDEIVFDLNSLTKEELKQNYSVIATRLEQPKKDIMNDIILDDSGIIKYLPLTFREQQQKRWEIEQKRYGKECSDELSYIQLADFLKSQGVQNADNFLSIIGSRRGFVADITGKIDTNYITGDKIGVPELSEWKIEQNFISSPKGYKNYLTDNPYRTNNLSKEDEAQMFILLEQRLNEYSNHYFSNLYNSADELLAEYNNVIDNNSYSAQVSKSNLYSKLQTVINSKEYLISLGLNPQELEEKIRKIDDVINKPSMTKEEEEIFSKKNAMDFYAGMMPEENKMREFADMILNTKLTDEEWKNKSRDSEFMLSIIDTLKLGEEKFYKNDFNERELAKFVDCLNNIWSGNITEAEAIEQFSEFIEDEYAKKDEEQIEQTQTTAQESQDLTEEKQEIQQNQEDPIEIKEYVEVSNYNQNPNLSREELEQVIQFGEPISTTSISERSEARHL